MAAPQRITHKALLQALGPDGRLLIVGRTAYLEGNVPSFKCKRELARLVADLPSLQKVVNRLRVVPGSPRSDVSIKEAVVAALAADPFQRGQSLRVEVTDGVVELTGTVPSISARIAAEQAAWSVCGVRHVDNRLDVSPQAGADPSELSRQLRLGILSTLGPGTRSVKLEFSQGTVYLSGRVASAEDRLAAEDWVRWHPMVRDVINDLAVGERPLSSLRQSA